MTISGTDECREEIKKMIENFDREDQALKSSRGMLVQPSVDGSK
jgi:hypothetical protein